MWFDTKRIVLTAGCASGGTELNALDNAMRDARIADFNIVRVTSIVPPGVVVTKLRKAAPIRGKGLLVPAVYETLFAQGNDSIRISAGVGVAVPLDGEESSGVIFTASGKVEPTALEYRLNAMINEGMSEMRLPPDRYSFESSVASIVPEPQGQRHFCAFAAAVFCDEATLALFE